MYLSQCQHLNVHMVYKIQNHILLVVILKLSYFQHQQLVRLQYQHLIYIVLNYFLLFVKLYNHHLNQQIYHFLMLHSLQLKNQENDLLQLFVMGCFNIQLYHIPIQLLCIYFYLLIFLYLNKNQPPQFLALCVPATNTTNFLCSGL